MIPPSPSQEILQVIVRNRTGVLFEGPAGAVSAYNERGLFDVLPRHSNFISIIRQSLIIRQETGGDPIRIDLQSGVLKVYKNAVEVYVGIVQS